MKATEVFTLKNLHFLRGVKFNHMALGLKTKPSMGSHGGVLGVKKGRDPWIHHGILELTTNFGGTWRIIPGLGYVVNNHGDRKSPKWCYSPYKQFQGTIF